MPLTITCTSCGVVFPNVPDSLLGKSIRCKSCATVLPVNGTAPAPVVTAKIVTAKSVTPPVDPPLARLLPDEELPKLKAILLDPPSATETTHETDDVDDDAQEEEEEDEENKNRVRRKSRSQKKSNPIGLVVKGLVVVLLLGIIGAAGWVIYQKLNPKDDQAQQTPVQNNQTDNFTNFPKPGGTWTPPPRNDPNNKVVLPTPTPNTKPEQKSENPFAMKSTTSEPKPTPTPSIEQPQPPKPVGPPPRVGPQKDAPDEATLKRVKASTVYIEVDNGRGGGGTGTGWFAFENGLIVTNAHVISMKHVGSKPPAKVSVFLNSGTETQQLFEGPSIKILGVDHENDLAILQVVNASSALPAPLPIRPSSQLRDLDKLVVLGFPGGRRLSERNGSTKAPVVSTTMTQVSAFRNDDSGLRRSIQLQGGVNHGASGGPLIDMDGNVVGVPVRVDHNHDGNLTNIAEAIPSEWVSSLAEGRPGQLEVGYPYYKGDQLLVPVRMKCIDPLKKVRAVEIGIWIGNSNPSVRHPTDKYEPQTGDVGHKEVALSYNKETCEATGELAYPRDPDGRAYWLQPSLTSQIAPKKLQKGEVLSMNERPPVERATVVIEPKYEFGKNLLRIKQTNSFTDISLGSDKELREKRTLTQEFRFNESIEKSKSANEVAQAGYKFNSYNTRQTRGEADVEQPKFINDVTGNLKNFSIRLIVDKRGEANRQTALSNMTDMAKAEQLNRFTISTSKFLESGFVKLPGQSTSAPTTYKFNDTHTLLLELDDMASKRKPILFNEMWEVTYQGRRDRAGRSELVFSVSGTILAPEGEITPTSGKLRGQMLLDASTGLIRSLDIIRDYDAEYTVESARKRAIGVEQFQFNRE